MVEIYCGDGKGKTTAAMGLAVRAAGHEIPVRIVQFLKDGTSGELAILNKLDKIEIDTPHEFYGFVKNMTAEQKKAVADDYAAMLERAELWLADIISDNDKNTDKIMTGCVDESEIGCEADSENDSEVDSELGCETDSVGDSEVESELGCETDSENDSRDKLKSENKISAVVIMDEVLHACNFELLDKDRLVVFVDKYRDKAELVLTGRNPSEELVGIADYVSEIKKIKHPYDKGIFARVGIEL